MRVIYEDGADNNGEVVVVDAAEDADRASGWGSEGHRLLVVV